jgi:hypothetical protein
MHLLRSGGAGKNDALARAFGLFEVRTVAGPYWS